MDIDRTELRYLHLLAKQYPSIQATSTEIIKLTSQLNLPKGTEHFVSDIHGAFEAFRHVLKSGSGSIRRRIDEIFSDSMTEQERKNFATLIYYPDKKIPQIVRKQKDKAAWYRETLHNLITLCRVMSAKYPRTRMEGFLPEPYAPIIEELLAEQEHITQREEYYASLIDSMIETRSADAFIEVLAELIQRLTVARLHVIGDVYDRGPGAHLIMDMLMDYHDVDFQWGNHDIVWMGAASGSDACIANVIRLSLRYGNVETLENGYGISLLPLVSFAIETYGGDPCVPFVPKDDYESDLTEEERQLVAQMHKAIFVMQLKLEGQIVKRRPHYHMQDRLLLDKIDHESGTVHIDGKDYPLRDPLFPTIDPDDPYALSERERAVIERMRLSFLHSDRLQKHVQFLFSRGGMYLCVNGNLLYHGCISMNEDGSFRPFKVAGEGYAAKDFMDRVDRLARQGYFSDDPERKLYGMDAMWFLWSGPDSPIFGKSKMATFERYLIDDPAVQQEKRNPYYEFRDKEETAKKILAEFGLDPEHGHIINGHVPVKVIKGESPVKANGRLLVIDGGFSKAYQRQTGIAGYTLVNNSYGLLLVAHQPFESTETAIKEEVDMDSETIILEHNTVMRRIRETDRGWEIQQRIEELQALLEAYRSGMIKEGSVSR